ncbi:bifunctional protein-disulfide isomerase/oxidoreductase DsbC [Pasteurellaceae bacterium LIM206]|nr:bifunctional protein-disulfide isomerase/oxidoreductase DsbC [Pasteurellaceae bacterium LIM206]
MKKTLITLIVAAVSGAATASDADIVNRLKQLGANKVDIQSSPIRGMKTAVTDEGILYVTDDGKYVLQGKLYELTENGPLDLTGKALFSQLETLKPEMIVYPAKNEKYTVTVFMDISCHYCHLLHEQIKAYNDLGITIRYLAFPRGGLNSKTAKEMEAIFTAKDPVFALNEAENGNPPKTLKNVDVIKKHYELGIQYGVRGTPSVVLPSGELIGGYLRPKELAAVLKGK